MDASNEWGDLPGAPDVTTSDAQAEIKRLAALTAAEYETERKTVAQRLGWRTSTLDAEVSKIRPRDTGDDADQDAATAIETIEIWPHPVNGASLAEEIHDRLKAHVVFGASGDADCATLWIIGSYLMETWRLWPRLLVTSPTKACGKSTLLEVLEAMVHRGLTASNASPSVIFRAIEAWKPTLLLDEADTWMKQNEELAGILNSGHTRRNANVLRNIEVGGKIVPGKFSTWCPMAIAGIGSQRDTLMSRSVIISLRRKLPSERVTRLPYDLHGQLLTVRRQIARWAADNAVTLGAMEIEPPQCGNDRMQDNFTPLWRIAAALGGSWPDRIAAAYAAQAMVEDEDAEPAGIMMLRDIAELFASRRADRISTSEIVGELMVMEERPWADWRHGRPINAQSVAKHMKPFGVKARVLKLNGSAARVYLRSDVEAAAARYASQKRNPVTLKQNQHVSEFSKCNLESKVTPESSSNALKTNKSYGVALKQPDRPDADDLHNPDYWQ